MERGAASNVILITIGVAVALLIGISIFFALQPPAQFDPHTPQGTAQGYFQAISDGDDELAESFMTADLARTCGGHLRYDYSETLSRVIITDTRINGDTARVEVDIAISYGDEPFGGGSSDQEETLTMVHVGDVWLISKPVWPMDRYACGEGG